MHLAKASDFDGFVRARETRTTFKTWPMTRYLQDAGGLPQGDLFIRLEHFEQDAQPLFDHLGFRLELPHNNRSEREQAVADYYTDELRAIVAQVCSADIARFGY